MKKIKDDFMYQRQTHTIISLTVLIMMFCTCLHGQETLSYQEPPGEIVQLVDAPSLPALMISPSKDWMILMSRPGYPDISELAEDEFRLGGIRINPTTFGPSRSYFYTAISLRPMGTSQEYPIRGLPSPAALSNASFSPDGKKLAVLHTGALGIELWVIDLESREPKKLAEKLNATLGGSYEWQGSEYILFKKRNELQSFAETGVRLPEGPTIQESGGVAAPVRTYQDLLKSPDDERIFDYYTGGSLHRVSVETGEEMDLGIKGIISGFSVSSDASYILISSIQRPYSYIVPYYRFPTVYAVHDAKGTLLKVVHESPLQENIPKGFSAVPMGKRSIGWRSDKAATLYWVEALDEGDPAKEVPFRDQVFMQEMPEGVVQAGPKCKLRYAGIQWGQDRMALLNEYWWATRQSITSLFDPSDLSIAPKVWFDRSREDRYNDPGSFLTRVNEYGKSVLYFSADNTMFLTGMGASPEGNRPFIDRFNPTNLQTRRLWRSEAPYFEMPVTAIDPEQGQWVTRRESNNVVPNYHLRTLGSDLLQTLTEFENPYEMLSGIGKEIITYERADGVKLSGTLYTPVGYDKGKDGRLPVFMWAYPREFKSADAASQVSNSPYEFIRLNWGSPLYWVTQGYAIFDDFSMPILGEGEEEPNETFVEQLRMSAEAAIDAIVSHGVADRSRIAVGGHSYGAFMTANLLAHTDLFAAGIARSGAYNRTLTPFGFQSEQRTFWEAPEIYFKMSPFNFAHKIKTPILLIHGDSDNNSGTFPMQSERFFAALKGHGATSRLVMLPHESHGYRARQSILHTLWEMDRWLEVHVKQGK